jgi:hypothetical protein
VNHAPFGRAAREFRTDDDLRFLGGDDDVQPGFDRSQGGGSGAFRITGGLQHREERQLHQGLRRSDDGDAALPDCLAGGG